MHAGHPHEFDGFGMFVRWVQMGLSIGPVSVAFSCNHLAVFVRRRVDKAYVGDQSRSAQQNVTLQQ